MNLPQKREWLENDVVRERVREEKGPSKLVVVNSRMQESTKTNFFKLE